MTALVSKLTWEGIIIYSHTTTPKVTPSSHAGSQHTTHSITIWVLVSKCLWAGLCCNREETTETLPRSCLIHYGLWKTDQELTMCALLHQNSHENSLQAISRAGAELGSANPALVFRMAVGQDASHSGGLSQRTQDPALWSPWTQELYLATPCASAAPVWRDYLWVTHLEHGWDNCQEAPAETKLKCSSIQQCFTNDYKGSKCMFQYRAFTWKSLFKRTYSYFCQIHVY